MTKGKTITLNRKALRDYSIEDRMEAGIVLTGTEIKSLRVGKVSLAQSFAKLENDELWLLNSHIAPYDSGNRYNHDPTRPRKLLLHRDEITRLAVKASQKRFALIPLRLYLKRGFAKIELGLAKGKKLYDKRQSIAQRQEKREIERTLKTHRTKS